MRNCSFLVILSLILTSCQFRSEPAPIIYYYQNDQNSDDDNEVDPILKNNEEIISAKMINQNSSELITPSSKDQYVIPDQITNKDNSKITISTQGKPPIANNKSKTIIDSKLIIPVNGKTLINFGEKTPYGINKGVNLAAKEGTKIVSAASGRVIYADYDATFGYLVIIKVNGQNLVTSYAHMEDLIVTRGQAVKQGEVIGYVGDTGKVTTYQLHFAIREGKIAKDPLKFIKEFLAKTVKTQ